MTQPIALALGLRLGGYALVLPWIAVALSDTTRGGQTWVAGALATGALAFGLVRLAPRALSSRIGRGVELLLWNGVLMFVLGELLVRALLLAGSAPAWLDAAPDVVRYRLDPAASWIGDRPNALGFFDEVWTPEAAPGVTRVAVLGDSYTVGLVPLAENYVTLADAALGGGVELLNFGVVHMSVPEYAITLERTAFAFGPDVVLVGIFIGNDIRPKPPEGFFSNRGSKLIGAIRIVSSVLASGSAYRTSRTLQGLYELEPDGTRKELPLQNVDQHRARERKHLERLFGEPESDRMRRAWRDTEAAIAQLVAACRARDVPILATLAPDEIQVDEAVFRDVTTHFGLEPSDYDLDYPNRRLRATLERLGVPTLDLLPALREAERSAPTHHLRAVHWNAHGNAAAARALVPWLAEQLRELQRSPEPDRTR